MSRNPNINEISAEMLLNYLYPELMDKWKVRNAGSFYRNYNDDTLSIDPGERTVELSRDGFLKLLPQGFISEEDELKTGDKKEKHKKIERRKSLLEEAFLPVDSITFRRKLKIEREISSLLNEKLSYLLKKYFNFEIDNEKNSYIKELAVLLPYIRRWKGDLKNLKNLLQSIFECEVRLLLGRWSSTDSTRQWVPAVRYEFIFESLNAEEYLKMMNEMEPFRLFVREWFIPAEMHLEMIIKDSKPETRIKKNLLLEYNTELAD